MNNQYILIIRYKLTPESVHLYKDREFLERVAEGSFPIAESASLYKVHYPLTSLVKSWKKEDNE